jgi:hypothetical protein
MFSSELNEKEYNELEVAVWDSSAGVGRDKFLGVLHFDMAKLDSAKVFHLLFHCAHF